MRNVSQESKISFIPYPNFCSLAIWLRTWFTKARPEVRWWSEAVALQAAGSGRRAGSADPQPPALVTLTIITLSLCCILEQGPEMMIIRQLLLLLFDLLLQNCYYEKNPKQQLSSTNCLHDLNCFLFFLVLKNVLSVWLIQNMLTVKFYCALVHRKIISFYPKLFFKNQSHNFKYVHITSKSVHSGSQGREIISGGFVPVPFSQSLTLDLGTVASPSRFNLLRVWHDHVSGELVKVHSLHRPFPSSVLLWWL